MKKQLSSDEIKAIELNILLELDRICKEYNLTYVLAYGTCLGAIRHQGFIPWDDDIDVFMPRDDYERLYHLFEKEIVETPYSLVSYRDGSSIYQILKLTDPTTESYETFVGKKHPIGLWVDIFPLERVNPSSRQLNGLLKKHTLLSLIRNFAVADTNVASTPAIKFVKKILCPIIRKLSNVEKLNAKLDQNAIDLPKITKADCNTPRDQGYVCDLLGEEPTMAASLIFPPKTAIFEGHELPVPAQAERYLEISYGDWKKLPPESQRFLHFPEAYAVEQE